MTIKDILGQDIDDFLRLNENDLRKQVSALAREANKRITTILKKTDGVGTQAVNKVINSRGNIKFSSKGKDINSLRKEFVEIRNFLNSKTSTLTGYKKIKNDTLRTLKNKYGINISKKDYEKLWSSYQKIQEENPFVSERGYKYKLLENISQLMISGDYDDDTIANIINSRIGELYKIWSVYE